MVDVPAPAVIELGAATTVDWTAFTPPAVTVTVAVCVIATALIVAETVLLSATVELNVPAATPLAFVNPGCVTVLPEPEAASTTVAPWIGLPLASCAVTVIVEVSVPAVMEVGAATTVDWPALTPSAVTVTVAVCVIATPLTAPVPALPSATVELSVPVATPLAFVNPGCVTVLPEPEAASTTVAPGIGFPAASLAVTVIVDAPLPAEMDVGAATTVDCAASTVPAVPVAVKVTGFPVMPDPAAIAVSVFVPALAPSVQLSTVATPAALVVWEAPVTLPPPEATAKVTLAPGTTLASASRSSTDGATTTAVPAWALWLLPPFTTIEAGAPAVIVNAVLVAGLSGPWVASASKVYPTPTLSI